MNNNNQNYPNNLPPELSAWLVNELSQVKSILEQIKKSPEITSQWIPRSHVMQFFGYGDTQMASLERSGNLVVTKVGNRKFIHRDSILSLLQSNIQGA